MRLSIALTALMVGLVTQTLAADLGVFPTTIDGKRRHVIELPKVVDQNRFMVELVPGRIELADCNQRIYRARIERATLDGWGYSYFVLADPQPAASTLKACPDNSKSRRFVRVRGDGLMLPYNSALPLVVFLPDGFQLKYRIWRADKNYSDARMQ